MGNKIARTTQVSASEYYLHDLPSSYNLVLIEVLGRGRFFKSILCKHDEGLVLVKVYFKRGDPLDLKEYERRLAKIREIFHTVQHPHVWPFQFWLETDKAAYLLRQYFYSNLHDRLSTRPFLSLIEKTWLAFQLLCAVKQSHDKDVCHGDIKCENVLVTSWNWLYLADFASFKPTYIPDDDPSDFSFFFDTGGRRRCYLAPERFYDHGGDTQISPDAPLRKSMDIFSVGCVIAELFLEGQPLFELSQLLAYRRGQYDPSQYLEKIQDAGIRKMILHMIQLDPESRLSCESYLQSYASVIFPSYFSPFLHKFFSCLIPLDSDTRVAVTQSAFDEIRNQMTNNISTEEILVASPSGTSIMNSDSVLDMENGRKNLAAAGDSLRDKDKLDKGIVGREVQLVGDITSLISEVEQRKHRSDSKTLPIFVPNASLCPSDTKSYSRLQSSNDPEEYKDKEIPLFKKILKSDLNSLIAGYNSDSDTYPLPIFRGTECKLNIEGMVLIASLLCSCIRSVKQPHLRRAGVILLKLSSFYIDDEDRLQHVLPYVVAMLSDPAAIVRCAALETLCDILALVQDFPPSDAKIFPEYILPMLSMLPDDPEESVRICYAGNVFKIALTACKFLLCSQSLTEAGSLDRSGLQQLAQLRKSIAEVVQELVMGPKQTPNIRRALLQDIAHLCLFFGQWQSNDFLLPILPAFLNDRDDQLRVVFYDKIVFVCYFVGQRSVEEYLLPYIEQALSDNVEAVIVNALECLSMLCTSGFLRKRILLHMIDRAFPLLGYPIQWVRRAIVTFIAASSECLGTVDSYVYLSPLLRPFLLREPASLYSEISLLSCLKPPYTKKVFYNVLKMRDSDMLERQRKLWYNSSASPNQWETLEPNKVSGGDLNTMKSHGSKEPDAQNGKYVGGMTLKVSSQDTEDVDKSRIGNSFKAANWGDTKNSLASDKLQFSGFISPHVSAGNSFICDGPSVPLYSVSTDRHAVGAVSAGPDSSLHWNSIGVDSSCMPPMDPVDKSVESSSTKLVSGSFCDISNSSKWIPKSSHDSVTKENTGQSSYISGRFQDVSISDSLRGSSSITGEDSSQYEATGLASFARAPSFPDAGWKPHGVLVAHLQEHCSAVNDLATSNDNTFFVSASDDSTVKIWDTRKLEKDISFRSRLTYSVDGSRALCTTMFCGTAQVAVGDSDGTLHLFSVDYVSKGLGRIVEKYSGTADIKKNDVGEGAILSLLNCTSSDSFISQTLLYSTLRFGIHLWDTRSNSATWNFKVVPEDGYISSLVMGQCGNWFVSGSSRGVLTLWDLRFLLPVNSWKYSTVCPVERMCLYIPPANSVSAMARPLIYVAAGCNEVSLWNAESGSCHQVFRVASGENDTEMSNIPCALARPSTKTNAKLGVKQNNDSKYRIDELSEAPHRLSGIRSLLPLPGGDLLTGGTDLKIRYWDHNRPERCYSVCGPSAKGITTYDIRSSSGVQVVQEYWRRVAPKLDHKALLAVAATDTAGCHRDSILSLASVKLNQRVLISGSRDGCIKVWK